MDGADGARHSSLGGEGSRAVAAGLKSERTDMTGSLCAIPFVSALIAACAPPPPLATGYVEGEFLLIAPVETVQVERLEVRRGDRVAAGDVLAVMESRDAAIALAEAEAALARARSELADLREAMRDEEIRVIEAELASARAEAAEAEKRASRVRDLLSRGIAAETQVDDAVTALDVARARVAAIEARLDVARLPARPDRIAAAASAVAQARAVRDAAVWRLEERRLLAPADGAVDEVLRRAGEMAGPQAPVLSLLPEGGVLLRLYAPEPEVGALAPGVRLSVSCDGCPPGLGAVVSYVADAPEFTPPVIYSLETRRKLVYLFEARPDPGDGTLRPGRIVDVRLAEAPE